MASVGSGLNSPPIVEISTMNAITDKYLLPIMGDATFLPSPVVWGVRRKGTQLQSSAIPYSVISSADTSGGPYFGTQVLALGVFDNITPAQQEWRFYEQPVAIPETDILLNLAANPQGVKNLVKAKFMVASGSMLDMLSKALWGDQRYSSTLRIDDIVAWLGTDNNVIAGIDRSQTANAFWRRTPAWAMTGGINITDMTTAFWKVGRGFDIPDMILLFQDDYAKWEPQFTQNIRYTGNAQDLEALQVGFREHFKFKSCVVLNDPFINGTGTGFGVAGTGYIIHTKYIYPVFFKLQYFNIRPWMTPSQQFVMVSYIRLGWNVICVSPQRAGIQLTGL